MVRPPSPPFSVNMIVVDHESYRKLCQILQKLEKKNKKNRGTCVINQFHCESHRYQYRVIQCQFAILRGL